MRSLVLVCFLVGVLLSSAGCGEKSNEPEKGSTTVKGRLEKIKPKK
jgi:ABC-type Fe3+-citrate transport system substrate-binding protein